MPWVYLDNNATTAADPAVVKVVQTSLARFCGNPSSSHCAGRNAQASLAACRDRVARAWNCAANEVYFTSGATESNNVVLFGVLGHSAKVLHVISSPIEHPSVLNPLRYLAEQGKIQVHEVRVDSRGVVDHEHFKRLFDAHAIALATVMSVNHEVGVRQDVARLAQIAHQHGAWFHCDMTQHVGKFPVDLRALGVDSIACSAHKFYGPPGVGALYVRAAMRDRVEQLMRGGDQEMRLRPGTESLPAIRGLVKALELSEARMARDAAHLKMLTDYLFEMLPAYGLNARVNGAGVAINLTMLDFRCPSAQLVGALSDLGVCVSSSSACKSRSGTESYVLDAMGVAQTGPTLRVGIGRKNTKAHILTFVRALAKLKREGI